MKTLNIIGAGHLGQTLGRLWYDAGVFDINAVMCRSKASAENAVAFIGSGQPVWQLTDLKPVDVYLISTPDQDVVSTFNLLKLEIPESAVVFHCSGVLSSLDFISDRAVQTASVHPVHSFADPAVSIHSFAGTKCGAEGGTHALEILRDAFQEIGADLFEVSSSHKALYHAAAVMACNYTVVLQQLAVDMYGAAGLSEEIAMSILKPIMEGTVQNIFNKGITDALTGPVARGDVDTIKQHMAGLTDMPDVEAIYKVLGVQAVGISQQQGTATADSLTEILNILKTP